MNKARRERIATLHALGFDKTKSTLGAISVSCSQCSAAVINGMAAHETGCPHATHECKGCNALLTGRQVWCEDCR